jgi:hypothetical protein
MVLTLFPIVILIHQVYGIQKNISQYIRKKNILKNKIKKKSYLIEGWEENK